MAGKRITREQLENVLQGTGYQLVDVKHSNYKFGFKAKYMIVDNIGKYTTIADNTTGYKIVAGNTLKEMAIYAYQLLREQGII